ncbi:hypothetical protein [Myxococcus sp. SDU36]|uniref:hypothetical protein n=1 Tax=Myxococcus sp. SDU36 TaxID=2831967 RepID=UPI0025432217|nr:hypothetical protein [Myxococcus sp. SDU36]WIG96800.1 hypothetical protein KGD87_05105 [Myxococcus sp. SDU36]
MSRIQPSPSFLPPGTAPSEGVAAPAAVPPPTRTAQCRPASAAASSTVEPYRGPSMGHPPALQVPGPRSGPRTGADNQFDFGVGGAFPPKPTGNLMEQVRQGALTAAQSEAAAASRLMGDSAAVDGYARLHLDHLKPSPPITGAPTSLTDYTSSIPDVAPAQAYAYFVRHPAAVFEAAGIRVRPATAALVDGAKLFLEEKGFPPVWAPITVRLEPAANTLHITTLDGHPLRGTNRFVFDEDGAGGTQVRQYSAFQGSSPATSVGMTLMDPIERQHDIWRAVHAHLHDTLRPR